MSYTHGWTWRDDATEDQFNDEQNKGACERFYSEIVQLYQSIPDPEDERQQERLDRGYETVAEENGHDAAEKWLSAIKAKTKRTWGEIEALEEMLSARGARLRDAYEHHNEFAQQQRTLDDLADSRSRNE